MDPATSPSISKPTHKKRLFLRRKLPLRIYTSRSKPSCSGNSSEHAPLIETPAVAPTMTPSMLMFGMGIDEYEAKFYDKRFETIPWDVDRVAESEVKEENVKEVTKKELKKKKKKSFVQRFKGDVNKYTIGMMGLEMEMRLRVEEKRVGVD